MTEVLVALSGGVDSSVAAACLQKAGYTVTGVTLKLWGGESDSGCCSVSDVDDARRVAHKLGIEHHVFNFGDEFTKHVVDPYVTGHAQGKVPNPCIECNRHIKFDKLFRRADALGFRFIATGHHAQVAQTETGIYRIARGKDQAKDQSYVINMLDQTHLSRLLLPVGALTKSEVRHYASDLALPVAQKPDSQNVCFINSIGGRKSFLEERITLRPAKIIDDASDEQVGTVEALELISIGQRKGLKLGGKNRKRHVININAEKQEIRVGDFSKAQIAGQQIENLQWSHEPISGELTVQCSAHGARLPGKVEGSTLWWNTPELAIAAGQSIVFYQSDYVVGSGIAGAPVESVD